MSTYIRRSVLALIVVLVVSLPSFATVYNNRPKLVVVIIIDQLRGDLIDRHHDQFGPNGFRLLMDRGADFTECYYDYVNLHTAPGHATLFTGTYTDGHGIIGNAWWDTDHHKRVTSVEDANTTVVGVEGGGVGSSPHWLQSTTLGDEMKLATNGAARVFAISLKDRSAILPAGRSGMAMWIDPKSGKWISSTYYGKALPQWVTDFNSGKRAEKYWNLDWKDASGKVLHTTTKPASDKEGFFDVVGGSPYGNEYEFEFARELVTNEKLGSGPATDLLMISLSANDILGHEYGPDSPEVEAMTLATDKYLSDFFAFLGRQVGLANLWVALSADHGIAPTLAQASKLHIPNSEAHISEVKNLLNTALSTKLGKKAEFIPAVIDRTAYLDPQAFAAIGMTRSQSETAVADAMLTPEISKALGVSNAFTHSQIAEGRLPNDDMGRKFTHSYVPGNTFHQWYVIGEPIPFSLATSSGSDHLAPFSYDTHVPLLFFGLPFQPGIYRTHAEPIDLAVTLSSLLGIDKPSHATGRVLTEALTTEKAVTAKTK